MNGGEAVRWEAESGLMVGEELGWLLYWVRVERMKKSFFADLCACLDGVIVIWNDE